MSSVKGTFRNGVARPLEPVDEAREGQEVIITFVDDDKQSPSSSTDNGAQWHALTELLDNSTIDIDVPNLAHEHDHYLYGKPKKN
jgi:hypothetical protein